MLYSNWLCEKPNTAIDMQKTHMHLIKFPSVLYVLKAGDKPTVRAWRAVESVMVKPTL
jgi:hypothetical protein